VQLRALTRVPAQVVEGYIFAWDKGLECVVLSSAGSQQGDSNVRMLRISHVAEVVSATPPATPVDPALPQIDIKRVEAREAKALAVRVRHSTPSPTGAGLTLPCVQRAEDAAASINEAVSDATQALFDKIHKTMPSRWTGDLIEVMQEVIIRAPYGEADCALKSADGNANVLDRVKHILSQISN